MRMYWVYDLPNWLFGTLTVVVFVAIGLAGLYLTRGWMRRLHHAEHAFNDIVGFYMAGVTVLYGVSVGLLAIGAWATYADVQGKIDHEAGALGALYRDVGAYPEPVRSIMQDDLRRYTRQVIDVGWPMQQRGIVPNNASAVLNDFQEHFMSFEPENKRQEILAAEAYRAFNDLTESRRSRLNSVSVEMPATSLGVSGRRSFNLHRCELVLSHGKFQRALLDDGIVFESVGFVDFSDRSSG